jgi:hypothetical protein
MPPGHKSAFPRTEALGVVSVARVADLRRALAWFRVLVICQPMSRKVEGSKGFSRGRRPSLYGGDVIAPSGWWCDEGRLNRQQIHARLREQKVQIPARLVNSPASHLG